MSIATITQAKGYFVESSTGRAAYCVDEVDAHDKRIYFLKEDRRKGIKDSTVSMNIINGFLVELNGVLKFAQTNDVAEKIAVSLVAKLNSKKHERERNLAKVIGERFRYSRETLSGFSQGKAASLLGISQVTLSNIENGVDGRIPAHKIIDKASDLYSVSIDFIYGKTEEWETNIDYIQERQIGTVLFSELEAMKVKEINVIRQLGKKISVIEGAASFAISYLKEVGEAVDLIRNLNPEFDDDIRGGASLIRKVQEGMAIASGINAQLTRIKAYNDLSVKETGINLDIFRMDGGK